MPGSMGTTFRSRLRSGIAANRFFAGDRREAGLRLVAAFAVTLATTALFLGAPVGRAADPQTLLEKLAAKTRLEHVPASDGQGRHVRLTYYAPVEVAVFWRFKTDFRNDWLVSNDYIEAHRFVARNGNIVLTETKYTYGPDVFFRWRTELDPDKHTLRYTLLNPTQCEQAYNRGEITLVPDGAYTRVTHISHFDFTGAFLWAHFPGPWGMVDFFRYTARWEQETILRLEDRYTEQEGAP